MSRAQLTERTGRTRSQHKGCSTRGCKKQHLARGTAERKHVRFGNEAFSPGTWSPIPGKPQHTAFGHSCGHVTNVLLGNKVRTALPSKSFLAAVLRQGEVLGPAPTHAGV